MISAQKLRAVVRKTPRPALRQINCERRYRPSINRAPIIIRNGKCISDTIMRHFVAVCGTRISLHTTDDIFASIVEMTSDTP